MFTVYIRASLTFPRHPSCHICPPLWGCAAPWPPPWASPWSWPCQTVSRAAWWRGWRAGGCVTVAGLTAHCCLPCPSVTTCSCARERAGAHGSAPRSGRAWRCSALRENSAVAAVRGGDWRSTLSFNLSLKLILRTNDREDNNSWARHDPTAGWRRGVGTSWISPSRL